MIIVNNEEKFDLYVLYKDRRASYVLLSSTRRSPVQNFVEKKCLIAVYLDWSSTYTHNLYSYSLCYKVLHISL